MHHGKVLATCLLYSFSSEQFTGVVLEPGYLDVSPGDFALTEAFPDDQIWSEDRSQIWSPPPPSRGSSGPHSHPLWDSSGPPSLWGSIPWSLRVKSARDTKSKWMSDPGSRITWELSKIQAGAGKMAQRVRVFTTKPNNLSLIPETRWRRRTNSHKLCSGLPHACHHIALNK